MKILLVCEHTRGDDGWSRYTMNLYNALITRKHDVKIFTPPSPISFLTQPWKAFFLARKLKYKNADVLHITVEPYALALLFLPKHICNRTILTIHGNYGIRPLRFWITRWLWPIVLRRITHFITVSNFTRDAVINELNRLGKDSLADHFRKQVTVIHNGIPLIRGKGVRERGNGDKKHILHIGGVKPAKGLTETIKACARYKEIYGSPFHLTVIGHAKEGHYLKNILALIQKNNLGDSVTFRGLVSEKDLSEAYNSADLLIAPYYTNETNFEGFGLVYIEANAYSIPVIGPNKGGAVEAIKNGTSGYTVDICNTDEIADRMHQILNEGSIDPAACRKWAEEHDITGVAEEVERIYLNDTLQSPHD